MSRSASGAGSTGRELAARLLGDGLLPAIYRAVEPAFPEEGCGFVFETPGGELRVLPTANRATRLHQLDPETYPRDGRTYFEPDMKPWLVAEREGFVPRVIFHSHPDTDAYFSATDKAQAVFEEDGRLHERNPGVVHLVVSVRADNAAAAKARVARLYEFDAAAEEFVKVATFGADGQLVAE